MKVLDEIVKVVKLEKGRQHSNPAAYDHAGRVAFEAIANLLETAGLIKIERHICKHENVIPADEFEKYTFCNTCWEYIDEHGHVVNYVPEAVYKEIENDDTQDN